MQTTSSTLPRAGTPTCIWPAGAVLGEGTLWSPREQALYWVDILGRKLHRLRPADGQRDSWSFDEEISAVAERASQPGLIVTLRRGFALFDPNHPGGTAKYLHRPPQEIAANRFNDGKCDAAGRFWGCTMDFECVAPTGALYGYEADGRCSHLDLRFPVTNGPTWTADGRTMFVNDTDNSRTFAWDFDVSTGAMTNQRLWLQLAPGDGYPDGMTTDAEGRVWIAHWGAACVTCHDPLSAAELLRIPLPTSHITNCVFGGPELRTLYITSARFKLSARQLADEPLAGGLFALEVDATGVPPNLFAG